MLDRELVEAVKLAREAGELLLRIYRSDFDVELKSASDPVTEADRRVNELLVRRIREAFPHDGVVAEESEDLSDALRRGRCWYVDPLDGTKEFVKKNGEFSVMIGLAVEGEAKLGVVYQPVEDRLYRGVVGDGAFMEKADMTYVLRVTSTAKPSDLRLVVSRSHRSEATDQLVERLGISQEARSGSVGLKVGLIARRDADLYVHLSDKSSAWDACAPDAILRAAGGCFTDLAGYQFEYGGEDLRNRYGILACNAAAFEEVLPVVRKLGEEVGLLNDDVADEVAFGDTEMGEEYASEATLPVLKPTSIRVETVTITDSRGDEEE